MLSYKEQLTHPNWQRKRLEIFERDKFTCCVCGNTEHQLEVHHLIYFKDKHAWEYNNNYLITMCHNCHLAETNEKILILYFSYFMLNLSNLTGLNFVELFTKIDEVSLMVKNDGYTINEAFKIVILKLIKPA